MADNDYDPLLRGLPDAANPTRELPTVGGGKWSTPSDPSAPNYPTPDNPPQQSHPQTPQKPRRTVGLASAGVASVSLLVIGLGSGYLLSGGGTEVAQSLASAKETAQAQFSGQVPGSASSAYPASKSPAGQTPAGSAEGPDDNGAASTAVALGAAVGTVSAINGASFTVHGLDGVACNVITTNSTRVATLRGSGGVRNLSVGDPVFVKGTGGADGVITADLVIAGAFPDLGAGTS